jgi:hypothetical protein
MPAVDLFRDCPGYAEAARREREIRDVPFLGQPETVAGIQCAPLTLRRVLWLQMVNSPTLADLNNEDVIKLLVEKHGLAQDLFLFYWIISPDFQAGNQRRQSRRMKQLKPLLEKPVKDVLAEVRDYMNESFMDTLGGDPSSKSFYSSAAAIVAFFRKSYGLDCDVWENSWLRNLARKLTGRPNPLDIPLKIVWQLMRANRSGQDSEVIFENRLSDPAVKNWLQPAKN